MIDFTLRELLERRGGYKILTNSTLKTKKKKELIDIIRILENNWGAELERNERQFRMLLEREKFGEIGGE